MKPLFLLLLFAALLHLNCHKDEDCPPDLPCATQVGANTFGCYINGKPWVAEIGLNIWDPTVHSIEGQYDEPSHGMEHGNFLYIKGGRYTDSTNGFISLSIRPLTTEGRVYSNSISLLKCNGLITYIEDGQTVDAISFELDTLFDYSVQITRLDMEQNIVAGIFSFTGTSSKDTIKVTNGRFDVKYDPY